MSYSGKFKPKNYKKYKGDPTKIFYRSLWERRFMVYCDNNDKIIEWGSEELIIPYRSPLDKKRFTDTSLTSISSILIKKVMLFVK